VAANKPKKQSNIDKAVEQLLENTRKVASVFPAFLRSGEKVEIEQRSDKFYWVVSWKVGGPFDSKEEAREGLERYEEWMPTQRKKRGAYGCR